MLRKGGGEEARSVRVVCDVCAAHSDRAAVGVDVDTQGSSLHEDETDFSLSCQSKTCRVCIGQNPVWFAQAVRGGGSIPCFPMRVKEKKA